MKFKILVKRINSGDEVWEHYNEDCKDPKQWAEELIGRFNDTLRRGESPRELIDVKVIDEDASMDRHIWIKTNIFTLGMGDQIYDSYRCETCGITAKRYGVSGMTRDSEYRAKAFDSCAKGMELLKKRRVKAETT